MSLAVRFTAGYFPRRICTRRHTQLWLLPTVAIFPRHCNAGALSQGPRWSDAGGESPESMRNSIAVMNTKGGVGKSSLVLALAETISAYHRKNVLVIDSDAQASVSSMLMSVSSLYKLQSEGATIVDYLHGRVLKDQVIDWPKFIVRNVSDVDDARSLFLLPS